MAYVVSPLDGVNGGMSDPEVPAVLVFDDPLHVSRPDPGRDGDRWHTIGLVGPVLLLVVHTWPDESEEGEPVGRIVSARKATAHERKAYEEGSFQAVDATTTVSRLYAEGILQAYWDE